MYLYQQTGRRYLVVQNDALWRPYPLIFFSEVRVLYGSEGRLLPRLIMEIEKYECNKVVALEILHRVVYRKLFLSIIITAKILLKTIGVQKKKKAVQILVFTKMLYVKFLFQVRFNCVR